MTRCLIWRNFGLSLADRSISIIAQFFWTYDVGVATIFHLFIICLQTSEKMILHTGVWLIHSDRDRARENAPGHLAEVLDPGTDNSHNYATQ